MNSVNVISLKYNNILYNTYNIIHNNSYNNNNMWYLVLQCIYNVYNIIFVEIVYTLPTYESHQV